MPTNDPDTIFGTENWDNINGLGGDDLIYGLGGSDYIDGGLGSDTIAGGDGDDTIIYERDGAGGNDVMLGERGNDTFIVQFETPPASIRYLYIDGGMGNDRLVFHSFAAHNLSFMGGEGDDRAELRGASFSSSTSEKFNLNMGAGNDYVFFDNQYLSAAGTSAKINLGDGADSVFLGISVERYTLSGFSGTQSDFLQMRDFALKLLLGWDGTNPFDGRYIKAIQEGNDVGLYFDRNGNGGFFERLIKFENVKTFELTAASLDGWGLDGTSGQGESRSGTVASETIIGTRGPDTLDGADGNDTLNGGTGSDRLLGGGGDDTISGGAGNDTILGGEGIDVINYAGSINFGFSAPDDDIVLNAIQKLAWAGGTGIDYFDSIEIFLLGNGSDLFVGSDLSETVDAGGGNDFIDLSLGDDLVLSRLNSAAFAWDLSGADTIYCGGGNDLAYVDIILDYLDGGAGVDTIDLSTDNPIYRTATIVYSHALSYANSNPGQSDTGQLGRGANIIGGFEHLRFGDGNDIILGWTGALEFRGRGGNDWMADYASVNNSAGAGNNDRMFGEDGDDALYGLEGNDLLDGGAGVDIIVGGLGTDTILGGAGADWMALGLNTAGTAGDGAADIVRFLAPSESTLTAMDAVVNFETGLDRLDLSAIDANTTLAGDQAFTLGALAAGQAGRLQITTPAGQGWTLVQADVDGDGAADLTVIVYGATGQAMLTAGDFVL
jgi:Ca2+-binding RTX toxin-like protein